MGTAAHEEVPPEPARDLAAETAALIDRAGDLLMQLTGQPGCDRLVSELVVAGIQMADLRTALENNAAGSAALAAAFAAGTAHGEAQAAARTKALKGRHAASRSFGLRVVQGIAVAGVALEPLGAVAKHPVRSILTASPGMKVAAGTAATLAVVGGGAAVIPQIPGPLHSILGGGNGGTPNPVASAYSATPIAGSSPSSLRLVGSVTKPKPDLDAKGAVNPIASLGPVPASDVPSSSSSSWPDQQASQQQTQGQSQAAPVQITATTDGSLDLNVVQVITITVAASGGGSGWASWHVKEGGTDLDFTKTSGVLTAGNSDQFTVTADAVLDVNPTQTFTVIGPGGDATAFMVTLPLPAPLPSVSPLPLPTDAPTDPPSSPGA